MEITRINEMNDYIENSEQLSPTERLKIIEPLYHQCLSLEEKAVKTRTFYNYAVALMNNGETEKAHKIAIEAMKMANEKNLTDLKSRLNNLLGNINSYMGRYALALDYYQQALRLMNQLDKKKSKSGLFNNIAILYDTMKMEDRALFFFKEAQNAAQLNHDYKVFFYTTYNIVNRLVEQENYEEAKREKVKFDQLYGLKKDIEEYKALYDMINAKIAFLDAQYTEALAYGKEALIYYEKEDDPTGISDAKLLMSKVHYERGEYELALQSTLEICEFAMKLDDFEIERDARKQILKIAEHLPTQDIILESYKRLIELDEKLLDNLYRMSIYQMEEKMDIELHQDANQNMKILLENMRFINEVSKDISKELNYDSLVELILTKLGSFMKFDAMLIGRYDPVEAKIVNRKTYQDGKLEATYDILIDNKTSLGSWVIRNRRECYTGYLSHLILEDYKGGDEENPDYSVAYETVYYTPLMDNQDIIGVFSLQKYEINGFDALQLDMIRAISSYISIALSNAIKAETMRQMNHQLKTISKMDGLSGLLNRYALNEDMKPLLNAFNQQGILLSTMMCDIDYFKEFNDYYGHVEGDKVIRRISEILKNRSEPLTPYIYRYGGDEFLLIFQSETPQKIQELANEILKDIFDENIPHIEKGIAQRVSISVGLAFFENTSEPLDEDDFLRGADISLYVSKRKGRNQVRATKF